MIILKQIPYCTYAMSSKQRHSVIVIVGRSPTAAPDGAAQPSTIALMSDAYLKKMTHA
jgi:hypothetical protein